MQKHEEVEFKEILIGLGEYYDKKITESLIKIYWYDLKLLSIEQFKQAASTHRMNTDNGQFFPKTADLMRQINGTSKQIEQSIESNAEIAWAEIMQCLRVNGSYGGLKIENKQAIASLKSFTTWKDFCTMDVSKQTWAKKEFISMYSTYENTPLEMLPSSLPGLVELENHKEKYQKNGAQDILTKLSDMNKARLNNKEKEHDAK